MNQQNQSALLKQRVTVKEFPKFAKQRQLPDK